jgi:thymidylate synthase (FAD)
MNIEVVEAGHNIETPLGWIEDYSKLIEKWGRKCYKSEHLIKPGSDIPFIKRIIKKKHLSVTEHLGITVNIICSRSCSHQMVRHRIASYSQESQRYVNYKKKGYQVICPESISEVDIHKILADNKKEPFFEIVDQFYENPAFPAWMKIIEYGIKGYEEMLSYGKTPEDARSVLPNAMKTEVISTFNLSSWRHVFEERALNPRAQTEIKKIMRGILEEFASLLPMFFEDQLLALNKLKEKENK